MSFLRESDVEKSDGPNRHFARSSHSSHHQQLDNGTSFKQEAEEIDEEELKRREIEAKKRLERRIEIAENGARSGRNVWIDSLTHGHDQETFNTEKGNEYGKLRYNLSEVEKKSERDAHKRKKDKKDKKKKDKKKKKKSSKKSKKEESSSDSSSESAESDIEAIEFNVDNLNKNMSDEEEADKMIIENEKRVK